MEGAGTVTVLDDEGLGQLVARAQAGDQAAADALFGWLGPFVRRRLVEARARRNWFWLTDLEGAVQDVATQFFQALRDGRYRYEGRERLEGFAVRTAFYVAMAVKDRAARDRALSLFDEEEGGLRFDVAAWSEAPYDHLERQECLKLLARAVARLNENRREVVERTLLGQKVRDICAATGRSPASVSGLKFNALVDLRRHLEEVGFQERCGELFGLGGEVARG